MLVQNQRLAERRRPMAASAGGCSSRASRACKATYTFTSRLFVRGIAQYVSTDARSVLYRDPVTPKSGTLSGSALLAYKLNWQSVMFVGYGDDRELSDVGPARKAGSAVLRQAVVRLSTLGRDARTACVRRQLTRDYTLCIRSCRDV